ncbi:hypothetical protein ACFW04_004252 [Cataglyphis niger]
MQIYLTFIRITFSVKCDARTCIRNCRRSGGTNPDYIVLDARASTM